jgi:hypothetical protein
MNTKSIVEIREICAGMRNKPWDCIRLGLLFDAESTCGVNMRSQHAESTCGVNQLALQGESVRGQEHRRGQDERESAFLPTESI